MPRLLRASNNVFRGNVALTGKNRCGAEAALNEFNCVHLGPNGCTVYDERPLICRLFGTTPRMPCPNDRRPDEPVDPKIEREVHHFIANTRQVLV